MLKPRRDFRWTSLGLGFAGVFVVLATGCLPDVPPRKRVRLIVTLDGEPLEDARVTLLPVPLWNERGDSVPLAFGKTDSQGRSDLKSANNTDLLDAVRYQVLVTKPISKPAVSISNASEILSDEAKLLFLDRSNEVPETFNRFSQIEVDLAKEAGPTAKIQLDLKRE